MNGHKLVPLIIDDQTSPSEIATAVQEADSKAFAIVSQSPLFFLAAKYPQQQGIPVTGSYSDGPEWGEQPYTNMFAADVGSLNPKYPVTTLAGNFLKQHGATNARHLRVRHLPVVEPCRDPDGGLVQARRRQGRRAQHDGSVRGRRLHQRRAGRRSRITSTRCAPEMDNNSNFALAEALQQAGVKLKAGLFATGYQPDVIHSPAWSALQGDYFYSLFRPWSLPDAATKQMQAAMEKYDGYSKTDFPSFSEYEAWLGADLMIKGLQLAGPNPTQPASSRPSVASSRTTPTGSCPRAGTTPPTSGTTMRRAAAWMMQAGKSGFTAVSSQPFCGTDIPGTSTASSS